MVAIVAVPFLLAGARGGPAPPRGRLGAARRRFSDRTSKLTVVEAKPGLRDYRKRLADERRRIPSNSATRADSQGWPAQGNNSDERAVVGLRRRIGREPSTDGDRSAVPGQSAQRRRWW